MPIPHVDTPAQRCPRILTARLAPYVAWLCVTALGPGCATSTAPEAPRPLVRRDLSLVRADPELRWVVACRPPPLEAREGKHPSPDTAWAWAGAARTEPYLFWPSGPGEFLDDYVASDPSGRYLVVIKEGRLVLIDAVTGTREDLSGKGADARDDRDTYAFSHRAADFDETGRLLYWRRASSDTDPPSLVLRHLASSEPTRETEIPLGSAPGPGPFRAYLDGDWVVLRPVRNGELADESGSDPRYWRRRARACANHGGFGCVLPARILDAGLLPVDGGPFMPLAEDMSRVGGELVRTRPDGAIEARGANSPDFFPRVPASCGGKLLASYRGKWLVACRAEGPGRPPLRFYERGVDAPVDIALRISLRERLYRPYDGDRLIPVSGFAENTAALHLDMVTGRVHALRGALVFGTEVPRGLVMTRDNELYWFDMDNGREVLIARLPPRPEYDRERPEPIRVEGRWAFVSPYLVDLDRGVVAGTFAEKHVLMELSPNGWLLARRDRNGPNWKPGETFEDLFRWIPPARLAPFVASRP